MKKALLILGLLFIGAAQAQITVTKHDGTPILNGDVFTFNSLNYDDAIMEFFVHNNSSVPILTRIECVSVTGASGAGMELCFGNVCLSSVAAGNAYPSNAVTILPGGTNSQFDHFLNTNPGNGTTIIDYVFKFYQENSEGDAVGNDVTITYRYNPLLSAEGFTLSSTGVALKSTVVENQLDIKASRNVQMEMFDVNGKLIRKQNLNAGDHSIDASDLNSGIYILNFKTESNQQSSAKFIKK